MRKLIVAALVLVSAGCQSLPWKSSTVKAPPLEVSTAGPIKPEEVTPANAHEALKALQAEIEEDTP